jgi:hypothetical protein
MYFLRGGWARRADLGPGIPLNPECITWGKVVAGGYATEFSVCVLGYGLSPYFGLNVGHAINIVEVRIDQPDMPHATCD